MLRESEKYPLFRSQNDPIQTDEFIGETLIQSEFLPANFYPMQNPGYTVNWSENKLKIVERIEEGAKIVLELDTDEINKIIIFDTVPKHERRKERNKKVNGGGFFKSFTGWLWNWSKTDTENERVKIVQVIPLMYDKTLFDTIVVLKLKEFYGFIRMRLLMTGSFKNIQRIDGFIPAISGEVVKIVNWKSLIIAAVIMNEVIKVKVLNLNEIEGEWNDAGVKGLNGFSELIICEDKYKERAVLLIKNGVKIEIFEVGNTLIKLGNFQLFEDDISIELFGYIEDNYLYFIQDKNLYKKDLKSNCSSSSSINDIKKEENCLISYLVPWRQDFQVSALIIYINKISENVFKISVLSIDGIESKIIHESDEFFNFDVVKIFVSSSLEIFLLDRLGNVQIYTGFLLEIDWEDEKYDNLPLPFEFSNWFNIFGDFPFRNYEFYKERRENINETLFIDDLLMEYKISFPPIDWKGLSQACSKLKVEIILYYLLSCNTDKDKINSFYYNFGLTDKQVAFIETCFYADHGDVKEAVKIFCTRKMDEVNRNLLVTKLVKYLKFDCDNEELVIFSLFCAGRLISIDLLIDDEITMNFMIESILNGRGVSIALDWIKGLFAWLRPDDRCALIPVVSLHQKLLKRILNVLLVIPNNFKFKSLGNDFIESQFDPDTLRSILDHLGGFNLNDRAAWLITMICASRGRLHRYLLEYDFQGMIKDEEVLKGIEGIKDILRPLVNDCYSDSITISHDHDHNESPLIISGTPQINRSNSLKSISYNSPSKLLNVYARTPSSPKHFYSSPNSPTFTPKHYPPKKPTMLSSSLKKSQGPVGEEEEEEIDPFKNDLIKFSGKRAREEILELKPGKTTDEVLDDVKPVILTKSDNDDYKFEESVIKVGVKRRSKRRRRD